MEWREPMDVATQGTTPDLAALEEKAAEAARLLSLLANENRLLLLCHLLAEGETTVGDLAAAIGLSQPALSQHLARLREDGLVATRKEAQAVHYRLADDRRVAALLGVLRDLYCPADGRDTAKGPDPC